MKSRAILLAEIEENRRKNNSLGDSPLDLEIADPALPRGYDPYDNPGISKKLPDGAAVRDRRSAISGRRKRL